MKISILCLIAGLCLSFESISQSNSLMECKTQEINVQTVVKPNYYCYIYPNPMEIQSQVCFNDYQNNDYNFTLRNQMGQRIMVRNGKADFGENKVTIYRNGLKSGRYYYFLKVGHRMQTGSLFIK